MRNTETLSQNHLKYKILGIPPISSMWREFMEFNCVCTWFFVL